MSESIGDKFDKFDDRIKQLEEYLRDMKYTMKRVAQTELQDRITIQSQSESQFGMYTGLCVDTIDVWKQNRIRFYCPLYHDPELPIKSLPWAFPVSAMGGFDDSGLTWVPPAGSTVCILFEGGLRDSPYYIGTTWGRNRGPAGQHVWDINIDEYYQVSEGHRKGYLCGPNDESQVLPPWNTENYNGYDLNSITDFDQNPEAQKRITYANIYGFKTPEKHMLKMVDGDPKCNRRWKRIELMSGCGNWFMMKDDHLHYAGQWAHTTCGAKNGDVSCIVGVSEPDPSEDVTRFASDDIPDLPSIEEDFGGLDVEEQQDSAEVIDDTPKLGLKKETTECGAAIIGGHPNTPINKKYNPTKYEDQQVGANPFFKHQNECRPYKGPGTPQNNRCSLPQSGIQIMSLSGHTMVFDDSVEEPSGSPEWERSMENFSFGCNDKFVGQTWWKTATGHQIIMSDIESESNVRSEDNFIRLLSACGNMIELNDHSQKNCLAGERRGITMQTTSNHSIQMIDADNKQCSPPRMEGGAPVPDAKNAFIRIRSGYGLMMEFRDDKSQQKTQKQSIQIFCPQKDNKDRGPHIMRFQEKPSGPGQIFLRSGGDYIISTNDSLVEIVGDEKKNPSNKMTIVSRDKIVSVKESYINAAKTHLFIAKKNILLLAGQDCPQPNTTELGPCIAPVIVFSGGKAKISDRVYASCSENAQCLSMFSLAFDPYLPCNPPATGGTT